MGDNVKANGDVHHLDHFVVAVMEPDRAEKFYTEVLGARTLKTQNAPNMTRIFMKLGENHVGLFSQGKNQLPKRDSAASYPRHSFEVPAGEYDQMVARIRAASAFVREINSESALGCCWNDGLVFQDSEGNFFEIAKVSGIAKTRLHHLHFDATDLQASAAFYQKFLNCAVAEPTSGMEFFNDGVEVVVGDVEGEVAAAPGRLGHLTELIYLIENHALPRRHRQRHRATPRFRRRAVEKLLVELRARL